MQKIDLINLDKSNWQTYRFDQIAKNISERVDPNNTDLQVYIGLEHIDPESIHIKRSGTPDDVDGQKLRFYPGDVIFGRRRAYQRKAAIATTDGFCSAHALVLRANPEIIDPQLFPFFLHSDSFMHRAVDISVGSLSPTINWGTLKHQEFLLPPKDQQLKLAELFWSMDDVVETTLKNLISFDNFYKRYLFDSVSGKLSSDLSYWNEYLFGSLGFTYGGLTGKTKTDFGSGEPYITYMNVFKNFKIELSDVDFVEISPQENQNQVKFGDILFTGSSETPEEVGMASVMMDEVDGYYLNSFCFGFRLYDFKTLLPEYAQYLMRGEKVRQFMFQHAQGSTRFNLSKTTVKEKLRFLLPSLKEQKEIAGQLATLNKTLALTKVKFEQSKSLHKSLINQIF